MSEHPAADESFTHNLVPPAPRTAETSKELSATFMEHQDLAEMSLASLLYYVLAGERRLTDAPA